MINVRHARSCRFWQILCQILWQLLFNASFPTVMLYTFSCCLVSNWHAIFHCNKRVHFSRHCLTGWNIFVMIHVCTHHLSSHWLLLEPTVNLKISPTYRSVSYLRADYWLIFRLYVPCMISKSNVKLVSLFS